MILHVLTSWRAGWPTTAYFMHSPPSGAQNAKNTDIFTRQSTNAVRIHAWLQPTGGPPSMSLRG